VGQSPLTDQMRAEPGQVPVWGNSPG